MLDKGKHFAITSFKICPWYILIGGDWLIVHEKVVNVDLNAVLLVAFFVAII